MAKKVSVKPAGVTKPTQMRLGPDTLGKLDELAASMGAVTRTEAVRRLIHDAHKRESKNKA